MRPPEPRLELLPAPFAVGRRRDAGAARRAPPPPVFSVGLRPSSPPPGRIAGDGAPRLASPPQTPPVPTPYSLAVIAISSSSTSLRVNAPALALCASLNVAGLCVRITRSPRGVNPTWYAPTAGVMASNWRSSIDAIASWLLVGPRTFPRPKKTANAPDRNASPLARMPTYQPACCVLKGIGAWTPRWQSSMPSTHAPCDAHTDADATVAPTSRASSESVRVVRSSARNRPLNLPALERYNVKNSAQPPAANGGRTTG